MAILGLRSLIRLLGEAIRAGFEDASQELQRREEERWNIQGRMVWVVTIQRGQVHGVYMRPEDAHRELAELTDLRLEPEIRSWVLQ